MRRLELTAEDMADLIAGGTINAMAEGGEEIVVSAPDGANKDWATEAPPEHAYAEYSSQEDLRNHLVEQHLVTPDNARALYEAGGHHLRTMHGMVHRQDLDDGTD